MRRSAPRNRANRNMLKAQQPPFGWTFGGDSGAIVGPLLRAAADGECHRRHFRHRPRRWTAHRLARHPSDAGDTLAPEAVSCAVRLPTKNVDRACCVPQFFHLRFGRVRGRLANERAPSLESCQLSACAWPLGAARTWPSLAAPLWRKRPTARPRTRTRAGGWMRRFRHMLVACLPRPHARKSCASSLRAKILGGCEARSGGDSEARDEEGDGAMDQRCEADVRTSRLQSRAAAAWPWAGRGPRLGGRQRLPGRDDCDGSRLAG